MDAVSLLAKRMISAMTVTAELIQLPVISPLKLPLRQRQARSHYPDTRFARHRIYREPHSRQQTIGSYSASGLVIINPQKGHNVDLYA
jgi:hypothetical protein